MKFTIISEKENRIINRKELKGDLFFEGATPKRWDMKIELAKHLKVNSDLLILKSVRNVFGECKVVFEAHVYESENGLSKVNKAVMKKNQKPAPKDAEAKKEEAATEAPKKEAAAEPKKEAPKKEEAAPEAPKKEEAAPEAPKKE